MRLLAAGATLDGTNDAMRRALVGLPPNSQFTAAPEDYLAASKGRSGTVNPRAFDLPFWNNMIRTRANAYTARRHYGDLGSIETPLWCF